MAFFPQTYNPSTVMRKHLKNKIEELPAKYLTYVSQNCQEHVKQGKSEKLTLAKEPVET